jgi:Flp pilus assembly pilin Flp
MRKSVSKRERGYTLLEYCAGAAIIAGILWTALSNLGTDLTGLLDAVGAWSNSRRDGVVQD